jgi:hypothetical protein
MSGYQFMHVATYSRKANPAGQSVDQIVEEAERNPAFSQHVDEPKPPRLIYGISVREMKAQHDAMLEDARVPVVIKGGQVAHRSVRTDRHTLLTAVASYPVPRERVEADPAEKEKYLAWVDANVRFLRDRFGQQLKTVIEHEDETHPHLHAYVLPDELPDFNAAKLHPGKAAKLEAEERAKAEGMTPRDAVKVGNDALKKAMRVLQDDYHEEVGAPCGMTRLGPGRRRMSRKQWVEEKELAAKASVISQKEAVAVLEDRETSAEAAARDIALREDRLRKVQQLMISKVESIQKREVAVAEREVKVEASVRGLTDLVALAADGALVVEDDKARPGRDPGPQGREKLQALLGSVLSVLPRGSVMALLGRISGAVGALGGRGRPPAQASAEDREAQDWARRAHDRLGRSKGRDRDEGPGF